MASPDVFSDPVPAEWDAFVARHPLASGYHCWVWRHIFEDAFGHDTLYLAARRGGTIVGVLPLVIFRSWMFGRFLVSLPFVNYGGVLADDDKDASALVDHAMSSAIRMGAEYVELRHTHQRFAALPARTHKVAMTMSTPSSREAAWAGLDRKVRNQIRKAEKSGSSVQTGGLELLDAFYAVFARNMRDLGTPVYPKRFFDIVMTRLADRAACVVVSNNQVPVAAAVTLTWRDTVEIPWASSLKEYRSLSPNTLLYWTLLEQAVAAGVSTIDFGRSSPDSGTYHFKRQWGAVAQRVVWEYGLAPGRKLPNLSPANPRFGMAVAAWKRLPLGFANLVGPHIVRSIP